MHNQGATTIVMQGPYRSEAEEWESNQAASRSSLHDVLATLRTALMTCTISGTHFGQTRSSSCTKVRNMVEGTFGSDGELKKTGPSDVQTAEGLGGSNIRGVEDPKTKKDANADTGKEIPDEHITNSDRIPRVGTDPASTSAYAHAVFLICQLVTLAYSLFAAMQPTP